MKKIEPVVLLKDEFEYEEKFKKSFFSEVPAYHKSDEKEKNVNFLFEWSLRDGAFSSDL